MKSIVAYVRSLLGWCDEEPQPTIRTSFKRDRTDDECLFHDDPPALKKLKRLKTTSYPVDDMSSNDLWRQNDKLSPKVRYVPIQVEQRPSTSTPHEEIDRLSRVRTVPVKFLDVTENGSTPLQKPRMHTPVRPVIHALIDDDDDDEVTLVESKPANTKKPMKIYIEDNDENEQLEDVVFVKQVKPSDSKKYLISKNNDETDFCKDPVQYYKLSPKLIEPRSVLSPRGPSKFKAPPGITKSYKKTVPVAKWMQLPKSSSYLSRNKLYNLNGRSTISDVFNLDEKKSYQELIKRVAGTVRNIGSIGKPFETINLAEDSASFRNTQRAQRKSLNEITLFEKGLNVHKENESTKEYDPLTVASINSSDSEIEIVPSESSTSSVRIDPLNSLRESFKDKAIVSDDWLAKVDLKYRKKKQDTQDKLRDARRESDIISKVNYEQRLAQLEHKIKYELSIPESLLEEPQTTVELPKLTEEQEKRVSKALGPGPPGQLLVEKFNLRIHRRDLQTLSGLNWLNDEVINFYMNLLMQRSEEKKNLPKVYATNTFFYPKLMQSGQAGLRRWTRKVDIFAHDLMVVPVHLGVHWCLSIIDFREKKINYLDSMGGRNQECLAALMRYLADEHKDKKGAPFDNAGWKTECLKDIPQQMNGSDCGMFACTFAEFASRGAPYTFSQQHMPYLRRKAALEILQGQLLL